MLSLVGFHARLAPLPSGRAAPLWTEGVQHYGGGQEFCACLSREVSNGELMGERGPFSGVEYPGPFTTGPLAFQNLARFPNRILEDLKFIFPTFFWGGFCFWV